MMMPMKDNDWPIEMMKRRTLENLTTMTEDADNDNERQ